MPGWRRRRHVQLGWRMPAAARGERRRYVGTVADVGARSVIWRPSGSVVSKRRPSRLRHRGRPRSTMAIVSGQPAGWPPRPSTFEAQGRPEHVEGRFRPGPEPRVTVFIDVGQGDATLVELPDSSRVLVDAGGTPFGNSTFDVGSRVLAPALWARGVRRLDALVLTHGDPDHIGGAPSVIQDFAPPKLWEGIPVLRHGPLQDVLRHARGRHRCGAASAGEVWHRRCASAVLHPPPADWERQRVRMTTRLF